MGLMDFVNPIVKLGNAGLTYTAVKKSDTFLGFVGLRLLYGLFFLLILVVGSVLWVRMQTPSKESKKTTLKPR